MTVAQHDPGSASTGDGPAIGRVLGGRYTLVRALGSGGLGDVFLARYDRLGRDVAIKVMRADVAARPENRQRFEREAQALGQLRHPNIVTVLDFGVDEGTSYLVMELAEGDTLDHLLAQAPIPTDIAVAIVRQILRALAYAHAQKIVHRDLKPANVVVRRLSDGSVHVVVLDFGIAKILDDASDPGLTKQGALLGTPAYMSPEQGTGNATKATVDVYAAGLVAYELLVGRRPFIEGDRASLLRAHVMTPPPVPSSLRPELAAIHGIDAFLLTALEKKPVHRFPDAGQMLEAFERIVGSRPSSAELAQPVPAVGAAPAHVAVARDQARPTARRGVIFGALAVVVGLALAVAAWVVWPDASEQKTSTPLVVPPPVAVAPVAAPGVRGPSPLDRGVPEEIAALARIIRAGGTPSRGALQALYRYNALHRDDARGELLLGRTYVDRRWYSDAIEAYDKACRADATSAADARLRTDLVRLAAMERFGAPAARVVEACLGAGAAPEVEVAVAQASGEAQARLSQLLERLRAIR